MQENVRIDPRDGGIILNLQSDSLTYHKKEINTISKEVQGLTDTELLIKCKSIQNAFIDIASHNEGMKNVYYTFERTKKKWFGSRLKSQIVWLYSVVLLHKQLLTSPCSKDTKRGERR
ncbi:hypothetical protein EZS27_001250 [termite gut metagenome]|uniref:Uncharacterized protein n=1 Tax=termite gut metagenome TaxID=433724 RepID=A0A5J4T1C2_9ZZZZ